MKKAIILAVVLGLFLALPAYAANILTIELDSINTAVGENKTVIYTPSYGSTIGGVPDNYYVVTVVPRVTGGDVSEDLEGGISADVSEEQSLPEASSEGSSNEILSSEIASSEVSDGGAVSETVSKYRESEYKFKVEKVYAPGSVTNNVSMPENGFILVFPAVAEENNSSADESALGKNVTVGDIEAGAPVAVYGVDFETNVLRDNAYVQIDLTGKGLMGDIPQTSDNGTAITFTIIALLTMMGAAYVYRRRTN